MAALESDSYDERYLGKQVLVHLGERAWPRLLELVSNGRGSASDLAREVLLESEALEAGMLKVILEGAAGDVEGGLPLPDSWCDPDGELRIRAMLWDYGKEGLDHWYELIGRMDPDPRVRDLALLLEAAPVRPEPVAQLDTQGLWAQSKPDQRSNEPWPDWSMEMHGVLAMDGAATIRAVIDGSDTEEAQCLFALSRLMESISDGGDDPFRSVRLGLDLIEQYRILRKSVLLEAIREGVLDSGSTLMGWRDLLDLRLTGGPETTPEERGVMRLPEPSLGALQQALADIEVSGQTYVDVVLPAGVYGAQSGLERWVEIKVDGVALIGEPGVQLEIGVRCTRVRDVILSNMEIRNSSGSAVVLTGASGTLRGLTLAATQPPLSLQDSVVEIDRCQFVQGGSKPSVYGVRMIGPSIMLARASLFEAGSLLLANGGQAYLDRCILNGGERPVVQGQNGGDLVLRDCVILGGTMGFQGLKSVLLEGVLSTLRHQTFSTREAVVRMCPEHNRTWEPYQGSKGAKAFESCPLTGRR